MDGEQIDKEVIGKVPTLSRRNEFISQIDMLLNGMYKSDIDELSELGQFVHAKATESSNYEDALRKMKQVVLSLPVLELTIAFAPNQRETNEMVLNIRGEVNASAVLDIKVNPYIVGGALITFEGKYFDGSILARLQDVTRIK